MGNQLEDIIITLKQKIDNKELNEILSHQELPEEACEAIVQIVSRKRAYYEGPGSQKSPTPYGRYIEANQKEPIDLIEK